MKLKNDRYDMSSFLKGSKKLLTHIKEPTYIFFLRTEPLMIMTSKFLVKRCKTGYIGWIHFKTIFI